jgi:predicted nuclease of predicted toxin-antitoxin system
LVLEGSADIEIWEYAKAFNYCIVTFDFIDVSTLKGFPPKIIWLRIGNVPTDLIVSTIRLNYNQIIDFLKSTENAFLELK